MTEVNSDSRTDAQQGEAFRLDTIFEPVTADSDAVTESDIARRIAAILDSAEAEAARMRERAQAEAASIVKAAHASAAERIDELTREPERVRDEAQRQARELVQTAEDRATRQVADAEAQARQTIHDAEQRADTQRRDMERTVAEMEAAMERRQRELKDEIRLLADLRGEANGSVAQVVSTLQGVANDLNRKLGTVPSVGTAVDEVPLPASVTEHRAEAEQGKGAFRRLRRTGE